MAEKEVKRVITIDSGESVNTLNTLSSRIRELKVAMGDLDFKSEEYKETSEEVARLEALKRNAIRGVTAAVEGSYNAYSRELSILQKHRKTLNENTQEYQNATKRVAELQEKLKAMDAEVGTFSRNVGNYSSAFNGLQISVNQVARELPSLTMSANQFFLAISNNLPVLVDNINAFRNMSAEQRGGVSVLDALGEALFSWNTLITIGITLLSAYGGKIVEWCKALVNGELRLNATEKAIRKFNDAIEENGLGIGDQIAKYQALRAEWDKLAEDLKVKEKFIIENKNAFDDLGVAIANVSDAERYLVEHTEDVIAAMTLRAKAMAAQKLASESYESALRLQMELDNTAKYEEFTTLEGGLFSLKKAKRMARNPEYDRLLKEMNAVEAEAQMFVDMMVQFTTQAEDISNRIGVYAGGNVGGSINKASAKAGIDYNALKRGLLGNKTTPKMRTSLGNYGDVVDASAEREKMMAILEARQDMLNADAEGRKAIEQRLADDIAMIEEIRLQHHELLLSAQLNSEELTAEERMAIEEELTKNKIAQAELQIQNEEVRAKREKIIKDKEDKEDRERKERFHEFSVSMASAASNIFKATSEMMEEGSAEKKAMDAASIVMDTFTAAMAGFKGGMQLPMPLGAIVAGANVAASIAMGAAQLKNLLQVAPDGSNAAGALSGAQSAPSIASSMPAAYTRSLQGDNELTELNKDTRVYVVESDITEAQKSAKVRVESASF